MRSKIRSTHSIGVLAIFTVAAILLSAIFLIFGLRVRELEHARLERVSLTEMLMAQTEQNFKSVDLALQGIQERLNTAYGSQLEYNSLPIHLLLSNRASTIRQLRAIFLVDERGMFINSSREFPVHNISVADREYFKAITQGDSAQIFIGSPVRSRIDGNWTLNLSRPIIDKTGKFRGVVVAVFSVSNLENILGGIKIDYSRPIGIYLSNGILIASSPHRESLIGEQAPELNKENLPVKDNEIRSIRHVSGDGGLAELAVGRVAGYPILLSVTEDENLALASWRETAAPIAIGGVLLSIITIITAIFLANKVKNKELLTHALTVANDLYQHTVNSAMDAIIAIDASHRITLFNPAAENMFKLEASNIIGKSFELLIPEGQRVTYANYIDNFVNAETTPQSIARQIEITGRRADGHEFPIESTISKSLIGDHLQVTAVLRDMTDNRRNEAELREVNSQLRKLSASLQSVREDERSRLSRELHDELGQQLTGLKLGVSWLATRIREGRTVTVESIAEMDQQLSTAISAVRRISTELRPLTLDDLGFFDAIYWHCSEFEKRSNIAVQLNAEVAKIVDNEQIMVAVFRILQESLTNVARHANATHVKVDLVAVDNKLMLTINDNGQGIQDKPRQGGIGLVSMRERAIAIGAKFEIVSSPVAGTTVKLTMPRNTAVTSEVYA